jgi:hypothetical protein
VIKEWDTTNTSGSEVGKKRDVQNVPFNGLYKI